MNDLTPVEFVVNQPLDEEQRRKHIKHALKLGLPNVDAAPIHTAHVFANGPSLRDLANPRDLRGTTIAVNGALKWCAEHDYAPDYWACCDPQAHVTQFLPDDAPLWTTYLIASKCHPSVFQRAFDLDLTVKLWHINDDPLVFPHRPVKVASTVTLCVLSQFRRLGFREFHLYGWDACYVDGRDHATEQPHNRSADIEIVAGGEITEAGEVIGGQRFQTTTSWALEARDAVIQLHHADYAVTIHGGGLIKAVTGR